LDAKLAVKYYREALRVADEIGMDPFSDEIIGVKIQLASLMEKVQQYRKAIDILEIVKSDNLKWVEQLGGVPGNEGKRTRVLGKTVGVSVKLGDLYANEHILQKDKAEESLIWAVETVIKEQERREKEGLKPGEGEWMTPEENGGAFEGQYGFLTELSVTNMHSSGSSLRGEEPALPCCPLISASAYHGSSI
jgi:hypothetical protein